MGSLLEHITADLSEASFFRELCFRGQTFKVVGAGELELADVFLWLESDGIIIQVKERDETIQTDQAAFDKWFSNKVLGKASDQIADTLSFFNDHPTITVKNARGLEFQLSELNAARMHKLIVFGTLADGVDQHHQPKFRISQRSGFIHLIQAVDFANLLKWTVTPGEMLEYLGFREQVVQQWDVANQRTERWLFGCFVHWCESGQDPECLDEAKGVAKVDSLVDDTSQVELHRFFEELGSWAVATPDPKSFSRILLELALLPRSRARLFKERLVRCLQRSDVPFPKTLYRILNPERDCLIVLSVPPARNLVEVQAISAGILMMAKYAARTFRAVGIFFSSHGMDLVGTTPIWVEGPWKHNAEADAEISKITVFQRAPMVVPARAYSFKTDMVAEGGE